MCAKFLIQLALLTLKSCIGHEVHLLARRSWSQERAWRGGRGKTWEQRRPKERVGVVAMGGGKGKAVPTRWGERGKAMPAGWAGEGKEREGGGSGLAERGKAGAASWPTRERDGRGKGATIGLEGEGSEKEGNLGEGVKIYNIYLNKLLFCQKIFFCFLLFHHTSINTLYNCLLKESYTQL